MLVLSCAVPMVISTALEVMIQSTNRVMAETIRLLTVLGDVDHFSNIKTVTLRVLMRLGNLVRICHLAMCHAVSVLTAPCAHYVAT